MASPILDNVVRNRTVYQGHVQGVGFRFTVRQIAQYMPVTGYVRNLPDGRVEVLAEGRPTDVADLLTRISERMSSYIESTHQETASPTGEFKAFEIRR